METTPVDPDAPTPTDDDFDPSPLVAVPDPEDSVNDEGPDVEQLEPMRGNVQLSLKGLGLAGQRKIETVCEVSVLSGSIPLIEGTLNPDEEYQLILTVRPETYEYVPRRMDGKIVKMVHRVKVRPLEIKAVTAETELPAVVNG